MSFKPININFKDLTGQQFGRLTVMSVVSPEERPKPHGTWWKCQCACGNTCVERAADLQQGRIRSCNCLRNTLKSLTPEQLLAHRRTKRNAAAKRYRDKHKPENPSMALRFTDEELKDRRDKYQQYQEEYRAKHGKRDRIMKHGIMEGQFQEMLAAQGGVCAICKSKSESDSTKMRLSIDHDHNCCPGKNGCPKCIRGLLCGDCNHMIGYAREDLDRLLNGAAYIERFRNRNATGYSATVTTS